jgi:hypothetical protein
MATPGLGVFSLGSLQYLGSVFESWLPILARKRQGIDQRVGCRADLVQRDLRIFPPEAD